MCDPKKSSLISQGKIAAMVLDLIYIRRAKKTAVFKRSASTARKPQSVRCQPLMLTTAFLWLTAGCIFHHPLDQEGPR